MLKGKNILIFLSGSIAVYKSLLLIRMFIKEGANVRVVASPSALKFVTRLSIETLSRTTLLVEDSEGWNIEDSNIPNHIKYAKWADIAIFAPITANSINKLAQGIADNIYLSTALALPNTINVPRLIIPSANTRMLENPITQRNIQSLKQNGYTIMPSQHGNLACQEIGNGAMIDIEDIVFATKKALYTRDFWRNQLVIVTGGGSNEDIDSVRCISNKSSGLQACNLALAMYFLGAKVTLISSQIPLRLPIDINIINVYSSKDYLETLQKHTKQHNKQKIYLFMAAAISDYIPKHRNGKLKKVDLGDTMSLNLYKNIDILQNIQAKNVIKIAFKAECDSQNAKNSAISVLDSKDCKLVCLNIISDDNKAFGSQDNTLCIIHKKDISLYNISSKSLDIESNNKGNNNILSRLGINDVRLETKYTECNLDSTIYKEYHVSGTKLTVSMALALYIEHIVLQ